MSGTLRSRYRSADAVLHGLLGWNGVDKVTLDRSDGLDSSFAGIKCMRSPRVYKLRKQLDTGPQTNDDPQVCEVGLDKLSSGSFGSPL